MSSLGAAVSLAGVAVAGVGVLGVISPARIRRLIDRRRVLTTLPTTVGLRIGFGILFLAGAPQCRLPDLVGLVGILELTGALALLALGSQRLQRFVEWWLARPPSFIRYWCSGALALGGLLAWAGGWR